MALVDREPWIFNLNFIINQLVNFKANFAIDFSTLKSSFIDSKFNRTQMWEQKNESKICFIYFYIIYRVHYSLCLCNIYKFFDKII